MSKRNLSENLEYWRCERPDEWTMDEFIKQARDLEKLLQKAEDRLVNN